MVIVHRVFLVSAQREAVRANVGIVVISILDYVQLRPERLLIHVQLLRIAEQDELVIQRRYSADVEFRLECRNWNYRHALIEKLRMEGKPTGIDQIFREILVGRLDAAALADDAHSHRVHPPN